MPSKIQSPNLVVALDWLEVNPDVYIKSVEALNLGNLRLCDAISLRPEMYVSLAKNAQKEAANAGAPAEVLAVMKMQTEKIKEGVANLPKIAHAWMSIAQLKGVQSKAKAKAVLTKASLVAPDKANRDAFSKILEALSNLNATKPSKSAMASPQLRPECGYCCFLGCAGCGPFCFECCIAGCLICN